LPCTTVFDARRCSVPRHASLCRLCTPVCSVRTRRSCFCARATSLRRFCRTASATGWDSLTERDICAVCAASCSISNRALLLPRSCGFRPCAAKSCHYSSAHGADCARCNVQAHCTPAWVRSLSGSDCTFRCRPHCALGRLVDQRERYWWLTSGALLTGITAFSVLLMRATEPAMYRSLYWNY
jgi:hypothetical protein